MYTPGAPCISQIENRLTPRILYFYFWSLRFIRVVRWLVILCLLEHMTLTNLCIPDSCDHIPDRSDTFLWKHLPISPSLWPLQFQGRCQSIVYLSIFNALNLSHSIEICELQCAPATLPIYFIKKLHSAHYKLIALHVCGHKWLVGPLRTGMTLCGCTHATHTQHWIHVALTTARLAAVS